MKKPSLKNYLPGALLVALVFFTMNVNATTHVIKVANNTFTPQALPAVMINDIIRWEWVEGFHTTTSASVPSGAASWNSQINSTTTSFEYTVTVAGNYGYICGFHTSSNMVGGFAVSNPTGIQQSASFNANLNIFPKPAHEILNVNFNSITIGKSLVKLYDIQGREVLAENADLIIGANTLQYSIGNLNNGIYFVEVYANKRKLGTQKIIKE